MHNQMIVDMNTLYKAANDVAGGCWIVTLIANDANIEDRNTGRRVWVVEHGSSVIIKFEWSMANTIRSEGWRPPEPVLLYISGSKILLSEPQAMMVTLRDLMQEAAPHLRNPEGAVPPEPPTPPPARSVKGDTPKPEVMSDLREQPRKAGKSVFQKMLDDYRGEKWTPEQESSLLHMFNDGHRPELMAQMLRRSRGAILSRLVKLGRITNINGMYYRLTPWHNDIRY